jgi:hypothetical protein
VYALLGWFQLLLMATKTPDQAEGGVPGFLNMLTYVKYAPLFRQPEALPSNLIRRFENEQ